MVWSEAVWVCPQGAGWEQAAGARVLVPRAQRLRKLESPFSMATTNPEDLAFRRYLANTGSAEELVKILASLLERAPGLNSSDGFEDRIRAVSAADSSNGKFSSALPELVKGRGNATSAENIAAENEALRRRIEEMTVKLSEASAVLEDRGLVQLITVRLRNLHCENVPDMDAGKNAADVSDPYLLFRVEADEQTEWRAMTKPTANAGTCEWEEVEMTLVASARTTPSINLSVALWDNDTTNPDDFIGSALLQLSTATGGMASGKINGHPLAPGARLSSTEALPPSLSVEWEVVPAGFGSPPETIAITAAVNAL